MMVLESPAFKLCFDKKTINKYNDTTRLPSNVVVKGEWGWFRLRVFILEKIVAVAGVLPATGAFSN